MKKKFIGYGFLMLFFATLNITSTYAQNNGWSPSYVELNSTTNKFQECKANGGYWINAPIDDSNVGKCLKIEDEGACTNLNFDSVRTNKTENKIEVEGVWSDGKLYFKVKNASENVEKKDGGYFIRGRDITVNCYSSEPFSNKNLLSTSEDLNNATCLVNKKNNLIITAIDFPRENNPEWYCPYDREGNGYPDDQNPYDVEGNYYKEKLETTVYKGKPALENANLIRDCSRRIFALGKSCEHQMTVASDTMDRIYAIRGDFYQKKAISLWRGKMIKAEGIEAYDQWQEIKNMSFNDIKEYTLPDSPETVKEKAIKSAQEWMSGKDNLTETPAKFFQNEAKSAWNEDSAGKVKELLIKNTEYIWGNVSEKKFSNKLKKYMGGIYENEDFQFSSLGKNWEGQELAKNLYTELLKEAGKIRAQASLVNGYISQRNMDLNIAVSIDQTSHLEVSKYLRMSKTSKENDLVFFETDQKEKINIIDKIIRLAVRIMGTLAVLLLIISGSLMVFSRGDENSLEQAKSVFIYTLLGLVVGFLSYTIVRFVIDTLIS